MDPKTDYSVWRFWFDIGQYIIAALIAVYIWLSNRSSAAKKDVKIVEQAMGCIESRVTILETGAISQSDLAAVYARVNGVSEQVANLTGKMDGVKGGVDMIQEYLLNNGGK